jgi:hypothetical protein
MFQAKFVEKIKPTIYDQYLFLDSCAVYEKMWENTVEPDKPQMTQHGVSIFMPDN